MHTVLVSVSSRDRPGLVAAIAGLLFDCGANLGDSSFAVLAGGAEFTAVCQLPPHVDAAALQAQLAVLPDLAQASITVKSMAAASPSAANAHITHLLTVGGGDRPGLVARLAELFAGFKVNIVRMDAQTLPDGGHGRYVIRFALYIPASAVQSCLAGVDSTAGEMGLTCHWTAEPG
jgi:glycine cleavage system transcriptional repressor